MGAKTIEGKPATRWPKGVLSLNAHRKLRVEWDDSARVRQLALGYAGQPAAVAAVAAAQATADSPDEEQINSFIYIWNI